MRTLSIVVAVALGLPSVAFGSIAEVVVACEARPSAFTLMNLGSNPVFFDFVPLAAGTVSHADPGTGYVAQPNGYYKFAIPPAVAAEPLSFRLHELACDEVRCAAEAIDLVPPANSVRSVFVREDGAGLFTTVVEATWGAGNAVTFSILSNDSFASNLDLVLTDGSASRAIAVTPQGVDDPNALNIVVGAPPLVDPTTGILDPFVQSPTVHTNPPAWADVVTFGSPF